MGRMTVEIDEETERGRGKRGVVREDNNDGQKAVAAILA